MKMDDLVNYCKQYGFIFQGSEIYGGLANTWDYGPLGSRLKNTIKDCWRKRFIQERNNAYEVDADILMHPRVWEASGHVDSFADPLTDCRHCKARHRADNLVNDYTNSSIKLSARKRILHFLQSILGSLNESICPDAFQVVGFIRIAASTPYVRGSS